MDRRRWYWRKPWERHLRYSFLLFLLLQCVSAENADYPQEQNDKTQDSTSLDAFHKFIPYESGQATGDKRSSSFFPLRGKKLADEELSSSEEKRAQFYPLRGKKVPDDLKRASYFMPMRGKKGDDWTEGYLDEASGKRASSFMPMRGKKKYATLSDFFNKAGTYANDNVDSPGSRVQVAGKRVPQFIPVRGKRSLRETPRTHVGEVSRNDSAENASNQPSKEQAEAFVPMRGKRDVADPPGGIATTLIDKKSPEVPDLGYESSSEVGEETSGLDSGETKRAYAFVPMRGRRAQLRDVVYDSPLSSGLDSRIVQNKRLHSFVPMRGKRSLEDPESTNRNKADELKVEPWPADQLYSLLDKKSSYFMPMRGRKFDQEAFTVQPWTPDQLMPLLDKKSSAFMHMRGRRDYESFTVQPWTPDQLMSLLSKKAAFIPMRGRKEDGEAFTVAPWTPDQLMSLFEKKSSSFLPMRGRKDDETFTVEPWAPDQLMSLLEKKSSSFQPMRGRKDDETFTVEPWAPDQLMPLLDKREGYSPMRGDEMETFTVAPWSPEQLVPLLDKKSEDELSNSKDSNTDMTSKKEPDKSGMDKRGSFIPMRGRRLEFDQSNFYDAYPYLMAGIGSSQLSKPYSNRGVKFTAVSSPQYRKEKLRINWDAVKRAFHASRGKRLQGTDPVDGSRTENDTSESEEAQDAERKNREKRAFVWKKFFPVLRLKGIHQESSS